MPKESDKEIDGGLIKLGRVHLIGWISGQISRLDDRGRWGQTAEKHGDVLMPLRGVIRKPARYIHGKVEPILNEDTSSWHIFQQRRIFCEVVGVAFVFKMGREFRDTVGDLTDIVD